MARARILLVEDVRLQQALARELLAARGHTVVVAGSAAEARDALARERFDVVLVDLHLPDGAGEPLLEVAPGGVPVVAVTTQEAREAELRARGFAGFIPKPLDAGRFALQVEAFLQGETFLPTPPPRQGLLSGEDADMLTPLLADLFADFARALPGQLEELAALLAVARGAPGDAAARGRLMALAHQLRGSAGTYGFEAVGDVCAQLEEVLNAFGDRPHAPELWVALTELVAQARGALARGS